MEDQVYKALRIYIYSFMCIPLISFSIFRPMPYYFYYYNFVILMKLWRVRQTVVLSLFIIVWTILFFRFSYEVEYRFSKIYEGLSCIADSDSKTWLYSLCLNSIFSILEICHFVFILVLISTFMSWTILFISFLCLFVFHCIALKGFI